MECLRIKKLKPYFQVLEMAKYIILTFEKQVKNSHWLDGYTKRSIITKLRNISGIISFVDGLEDPRQVDEIYAEVGSDAVFLGDGRK